MQHVVDHARTRAAREQERRWPASHLVRGSSSSRQPTNPTCSTWRRPSTSGTPRRATGAPGGASLLRWSDRRGGGRRHGRLERDGTPGMGDREGMALPASREVSSGRLPALLLSSRRGRSHRWGTIEAPRRSLRSAGRASGTSSALASRQSPRLAVDQRRRRQPVGSTAVVDGLFCRAPLRKSEPAQAARAEAQRAARVLCDVVHLAGQDRSRVRTPADASVAASQAARKRCACKSAASEVCPGAAFFNNERCCLSDHRSHPGRRKNSGAFRAGDRRWLVRWFARGCAQLVASHLLAEWSGRQSPLLA